LQADLELGLMEDVWSWGVGGGCEAGHGGLSLRGKGREEGEEMVVRVKARSAGFAAGESPVTSCARFSLAQRCLD
jgi:hypothetical protein